VLIEQWLVVAGPSAIHKIDTWVSLAGPLMGLYGPTNPAFNQLVNVPINVSYTNMYKYLYTEEHQQFSLSNYWNDPYRKFLFIRISDRCQILTDQDLFREYCTELSAINGYNNDTIGDQLRRDSFLQLNRLLLFASPDDGVIEPWVIINYMHVRFMV
jgi:hypothetical protein